MKRLLSALLAVLLMMGSCAYAESPAGYPEVMIDPATGKAYDLGGRTVTIIDYWTYWGRDENPDDYEAATYAYQDWLMETYNCTITQTQGTDWGNCADKMREFVSAPDGSLRVYIIEPGKVNSLMADGSAADWNRSVTVDTSDPRWNQAVVDFSSAAGGTYGVSAGNHEPRECVFFNKRLLTEAGIDWNTIYDMQQNKTWTWDVLESMLAKAQRDTDNDGVIDVYGMTGSNVQFFQMGVFSNGGSFFEYDADGKLQPGMTDEKTVTGLNWAKDIWNRYARKAQDGDNWNYYVDVWQNAQAAFYIGQTYEGFGGSTMSGLADEWGMVAFPLGPGGSKYLTLVSENTALIPNVYDDRDLSLISMIYDMWVRTTPGYDTEDGWIGNKYNYTDERAVEETYGMLREPENAMVDLTTLLGTVNDVLGVSLLWSMESATVEELIEAGLPAWQEMCDQLNAKRQLTVDLSGYDTMTLPSDLVNVEAEAFTGTDAQVIVLPDGCKTIGANAFSGCSRLLYVVVPSSVTSISPDAFSGCTGLQRVLVYRKSYASQFCWENGLTCMYLAEQQLFASPRMWTVELE